MTENEQVDRGVRGEPVHRYRPETPAAIPSLVRAARVRRSRGKPASKVRVKQVAKCPDGCRVPKNAAQPPVFSVLDLTKAIAVLDERLPASERARPRPHVVVDADVSTEHVAAPTIVITRDPEHRRVPFYEIRQSRENAE